MQEPTDPQLVARINDGDTDAFELLYHRYREWALRLARRHTGTDHDALDVLQETFAYLHRKFPGFVLTASLKTLLFRVITNSAIRANQKRRRHVTGLEIPDLPTGQLSNDGDEDRSQLAAAIEQLSAGHRQVVLLRFLDGMSTQEIATALAIAPGTVKSRLHHALGQLRSDPALKRYFDPA